MYVCVCVCVCVRAGIAYREYFCNAVFDRHYPQTKATVVADTPEQQRLARTSQMQSQVVIEQNL